MANLSGTWLGTYWQDDMPTRFEMTIAQSGNALSGNTALSSYVEYANILEILTQQCSNVLHEYG
jgi:hypothetical protein